MSVVWYCNYLYWNSLMSSTLIRAAAGFISGSFIKQPKTTITTVRVAAPCPLPHRPRKNVFPLSGKGAATGRLYEKTLLALKVNSGLFKLYRAFFYLVTSVGDFRGIELLLIVPKNGYNSPQDSVVLVVVVQRPCIWSCSDSEVY